MIPEFPAHALELCDRDLGALLLGHYILVQALHIGCPTDPIPPEFAQWVIERILKLEAQTASNAALEKALHKAGIGEFETAGRLMRQHLLQGAQVEKFLPMGKKRWEQTKEFGRRGAQGNKEEGETNQHRVMEAWREIKARPHSPQLSQRGMARLISRSTGMPESTVRGHLSKLGKEKKLD